MRHELGWGAGVPQGFPGGSVIKKPPANTGDARGTGSTPASEGPLEGEMATHSSVLAWRIPWTEESGGLQSLGSQGIGRDCVTEHAQVCPSVRWLGRGH